MRALTAFALCFLGEAVFCAEHNPHSNHGKPINGIPKLGFSSSSSSSSSEETSRLRSLESTSSSSTSSSKSPSKFIASPLAFGVGTEKRWLVTNWQTEMVIKNCDACNNIFEENTFAVASPEAYRQYILRQWNQTLYMTQLPSNNTRFVFDHFEGGHVKVLTEWVNDTVVYSTVFEKQDTKANDRWRIVKIPNVADDRYHILSASTGRALTVSLDKTISSEASLLTVQAFEEGNGYQVWFFQDADAEYKMGGMGLDSSFISSSSSEEGSGTIALKERQRGNCPRRQPSTARRWRHPAPNSQCYHEDVGRKTSSPSSCKTYLECLPRDCTWHEYHCSHSRTWNNAQKKCLQKQSAGACDAEIGEELTPDNQKQPGQYRNDNSIFRRQ